jgi:4-carboxymuconolactone decarboxylase
MTETTSRFEQGLALRKAVVGEEYVTRSFANADDFTQEFQEYVTEFCWGVPWTRDGIDHHTRSLITVTALATMGKSAELQSHARGALRNGATPEEIKEIFLHLAVYAGVPTALEAFRSVQPIIAAYRENGNRVPDDVA